MKKILIVFLFALASFDVGAQDHNFRTGWCAFAKPKGKGNAMEESEAAVCKACRATREKETEAKAKEDKRLDDIARARNEAEKKASIIVAKKKQEEIDKKNQMTEVRVVAPKTTATATKKTEPIKGVATKTLVGVTEYAAYGRPDNYFKNEKGEKVLERQEWYQCDSSKEISSLDSAPSQVGRVKFGYGWGDDFSYNLVDPQGNYLLPEGAISTLFHLRDNWFYVGNKDSSVYIFNIATKKKIYIPNISGSSFTMTSPGMQPFTHYPIYPESLKLNTSSLTDTRQYVRFAKSIKAEILKNAGSVVTEEFLNSYEIVLVDTDFKYGFKEVKPSDIVTYYLHCIDKKGQITTISIY